MERYNNYVKINLDAIGENFRAVEEKCGVPVMAVVKADAYGHGAVQVARHLKDRCRFFGVSSLSEGLELRRAGIDAPILILGHTPGAGFAQAVAEEIRLTVSSYEDAFAISQEAIAQNKTAWLHLAVDTGMSRIGFQVTEEAARICGEISRLPGILVEGVFSHFATADCRELDRAQAQARLFDRFCSLLSQHGVHPALRHLDNSAGIMNFAQHYEMVRSGIVTYGLYPSDEVDPQLLPLTPAMSWHSHIAHVKWLEAGRQIGYGGTFTTAAPTRVATIPVGYADGYRRSLSSAFYVLIRGRKAPILGRVCMDQMMVDVTDIPEAAQDDPVVLVGSDESEIISWEAISQAAGSFNYEFVCGISRRVARQYIKDGKPLYTIDFLLD